MEKQKKQEQIESIDDEVNVLHPLLSELLSKLANVSYVEYTHGPHEMGADFVVERIDPALRETYYVGVIAKTEKILQNFSELERQVSECDVKRLIRSGKQEIRLQEIWVITTKGISQNAKIKISEKYPNRKIHFFDANWLLEIIDHHFPYYWHQLPTATGTYLALLSKSMAELNAQTSVLHVPGLAEGLIELDVEWVEEDSYKSKAAKKQQSPQLVNFQKEVLANKITLLEGDMGFGKSKLVRNLATELANPDVLKQQKILPVFQPFSIFLEGEYTTLEDRLQALVGKSVFDEAIRAKTKFLFILDGLDEANGDAVKRREAIKTLLADVRASEHVQLLITSRPYKLLEEMSDVKKTIKRYRIRPVSPRKLIAFITRVCEQINLPKKLYQDLAKSDLFRQLPQNPIAAALITNLLSQNKNELPSNLTELYSKSLEFMLGRWDEKKGALTTEKIYSACERLSRHVACYMVDNQLIYISADEAKHMVELFLKERNMGVSAEDVSSYLFERCGVFGKLEDTQTIFFRHRSFAEYLYALDAYERRNLEVSNKAFHPYWMNVVFFYIGLLAECPEVLRSLTSQELKEESQRWIRLFQLGNYFLAGYQSPYVVVEDGVRLLLIEFAKVYLAVKNGQIKTDLRTLSEMNLLWTFAGLTKHVCGYEFFHKALPLAMAQIDEDESIDNETRMYALFLAACVLGDIEDVCGFTFLLEKHKTEALPLPISLGLRCECEYPDKDFSNNKQVKNHIKKLRQMMTPQKGEEYHLQDKLTSLFHKPLASFDKRQSPSKLGGG